MNGKLTVLMKNKIVPKNWGWEEIFADNNGMYRGKILFINKGHGFHLQKHNKKDETLYVVKGEGTLRTNNSNIKIKQGDTFRFKPGDVHKISATRGMMIFEVSNAEPDSDVEHLD